MRSIPFKLGSKALYIATLIMVPCASSISVIRLFNIMGAL